MNVVEKLKINKELQQLRSSLASEKGLVARMQLNKRYQEVRKLLGAAQQAAPSPQNPAQAHFDVLARVAQGAHDSESLEALWARIKEAVQGLEQVKVIGTEAGQKAANAAIDQWSRLEQKQYA